MQNYFIVDKVRERCLFGQIEAKIMFNNLGLYVWYYFVCFMQIAKVLGEWILTNIGICALGLHCKA